MTGTSTSMSESHNAPAPTRRPPDEERDPEAEQVERIDPDAPARSMFDQDEDAVEPNEPA